MQTLSQRRFFPMYYAGGVADVTPEFIRGCGCDALLLDIDNTVSHVDAPEATKEAEAWLQTLRQAGLPVAFVSNNDPERVEPFARRYGARHLPQEMHAASSTRTRKSRAARAMTAPRQRWAAPRSAAWWWATSSLPTYSAATTPA